MTIPRANKGDSCGSTVHLGLDTGCSSCCCRVLPLADIHPLGAVEAGAEPRAWVRARVAELMATLPDPQVGQEDERWEWAAPLLLDPGLRAFLQEWSADQDLPHPNPDHFREYVADLLGLNPIELGRRPPRLLELLTDVALGSPAVLAARSATMSGARHGDTSAGGCNCRGGVLASLQPTRRHLAAHGFGQRLVAGRELLARGAALLPAGKPASGPR